jgi:5'-nucleotidase
MIKHGFFCLALLGACHAQALNILVSNDDSCNAEGVNVLADALETAGHTVTVVSPAGEQSGKSGSYSTYIFRPYDVSNVGFEGPTGADNRYCVRVPTISPEEGSDEEFIASASPRDSLLVGLQLLADTPPDLVVSGINDGQNIGAAAVGSGTVGAAVAALQQGIPAIAVSRNRFRDSGQPLTFEQLAELVVDLVAALEAQRPQGEALLPPQTGLNVNTPSRTPRGVAYTQLGTLTDVHVEPGYRDGQLVVNFFRTKLADLIGEEAAAELEADPDATLEDFAAAGLDVEDETSASIAGFVTISTIDGDFTAQRRKRELVQVRLQVGASGE